MRTERISAVNEGAALEYLARSPYTNVFLSHILAQDAHFTPKGKVFVAKDDTGVHGVAYYGRALVIAADNEALSALADRARRLRGDRMIIGPRATIREFWKLVADWHAPPRLVRDRQLVMVVDREHLRPLASRVAVRHAKASEWRLVSEASAHMVQQELEYNPRRNAPNFDANVRQMIADELFWVGETNGELCFFCNIGPWSEKTAQLQGIWTPPPLRGRGYATSALAAICDRLLASLPTLSLFVNDFNHAAVELYRRVGFEHVADFQTIMF